MKTDSLLNSIQIVMINTSHPGNIGAAARAMRVMGFYNLTLVNPKKFPSEIATSFASGALDILENTTVTQSLEEAIKDCDYVIGTTARSRQMNIPERELERSVKTCKELLVTSQKKSIALLFGAERTGLTNEEIDLCNELAYIPTENSYNSLNIAAAIQVITYEFHKIFKELSSKKILREKTQDDRLRPATQKELEGYFKHLEETLIQIKFINNKEPTHLMRKLRILYKKADLTVEEINILRGILTETLRRCHD